MLRIKNKLYVFYDDNNSFTDYSDQALDFDRDTFSFALDQNEDYLYVGFYKPISTFYVELDTANTSDGKLVGQYYNGTTWTTLEGFYDETKSLQRSGYVQWDRNQAGEKAVEINSQSAYWYRFRPSASHSSTTFNGLNIVFADDNDLKREFFEVSEFLPNGQASHILTHVASRDHIIQFLRNSGHYKESLATGRLKDITAFDILEMGQIKLAATYLALSKIFSNVQDSTDDLYLQRSNYYMGLYSSAIKTFYLDLDFDDDGLKDQEEELASSTGRLLRR